jgi:hypothetical protein
MAELVQVSGSSKLTPSAPARPGWPRAQRLGLMGGAGALALWIVISPNVYAAVACLLVTLIYASRVWPKVCRLIVFAAIPNNLIWTGFVFLRGLGDGSPFRPEVRLYVRRLECWLFGGEMPSSILQRHLFDPAHIRPWDYFFLGVHASFFVMPSIFFFGLWWSNRARSRRYMASLVMILGTGAVMFWLLPSNPPWMNPASGDPNPVPVMRVNYYVAQRLGITSFAPDGSLAAENNSLAAMPSIHMAVTFLCALAWRRRRPWSVLSAGYLVLMTFSLVYLGEHHVVDELAGVAMALIAWRLAPSVVSWSETVAGPRLTSIATRVAEQTSKPTRRLRIRLGLAD